MYANNIGPSAKRDDRIARPRRAQTFELCEKRGMKIYIFFFNLKLS